MTSLIHDIQIKDSNNNIPSYKFDILIIAIAQMPLITWKNFDPFWCLHYSSQLSIRDNDVLYEATTLIFKCDREWSSVSSIQDTCCLEGFNAVPEGLLKRPEFPAKRLQLLGTEWRLVAHLDEPAIGWGTKYVYAVGQIALTMPFQIHPPCPKRNQNFNGTAWATT